MIRTDSFRLPRQRGAWWVLVVLALAGCGRHEARQPLVEAAPPAVNVSLAAVSPATREEFDEVVGTVKPKVTAQIAAKISGTIIAFPARTGSVVHKNDLLVELEAREVLAQLDQAQAVLDQTTSELARTRKLIEQRVATQVELEADQRNQKVAQAKVDEIRTMLSYNRVVAPFDGVVAATYADQGDLATPGRSLLLLEEKGAMRLEAFIPEGTVGNLTTGQVCTVIVAALAKPLTGAVAEISPAADPASRSFLVKFDLPNVAGLRSGQFGRVRIPVGSVETLTVPAAALVTRGQMDMVFVVGADHHAALRLVKTGKRIGDSLELLSGVVAGEQVVASHADELSDGQAVVVAP